MKTLLGLLFGVALGVVAVLASMTFTSLEPFAPAIFVICATICLVVSYASSTTRVSAQRLFGLHGIVCIPAAASIWLASGNGGPHIGTAVAFAVMILMLGGVVSILIAFFLAKSARAASRSA